MQVVAAAADFSLAAFPVSFIKDLHVSLRRKVALACLMLSGYCKCTGPLSKRDNLPMQWTAQVYALL